MTRNAPLSLYGDRFWISPYVFSCYVALCEKGLEFQMVELALDRREQRRPEYLDRAVTGKVPALAHGHFWLTESSAIIEYLEEAFPEHARVLPADLEERARVRQVMAFLRSDLVVLREERPTTTMFYARAGSPLSAAGRAAVEKLFHVAGALLAGGKSLLASSWSIADADLAFMLHRLILNGDEVPAPLRAYAEAQWRRPSIRSYVERTRPPYVPY
jgi:glutathione S-transferase